MARLRLLTVALSVFGVATAQAEIVHVGMEAYDQIGQTTLWRADLSGADGTIRAVAIKDLNTQGGSSGVFSGFDVDFLVFDRDGDLSTVDDRILPTENPLTFVGNDGTVRKGLDSIYKPTAAHPGRLFGLNEDNSIDFATATLGIADAVYLPGVQNLSVDTSNGWVSIGDGGSIRVAFPLTSVSSEGSLFLFLGDVGLRDEFGDGLGEIQLSVDVPKVSIFEGSYELGPDGKVNIDATLEGITAEVKDWAWDLDGDGDYDDGSGQVLGVSFDHFVNTLGMVDTQGNPLPSVQIAVRAAMDGEAQEIPFTVMLPEPAALTLLAVLSVPVLLRRRRKA